VLEQRKGKGIWQNLYQFPLIESERNITKNEIFSNSKILTLAKDIKTISLYNEKEIIHKLSHQHLYTKFWIIETNQLRKKGVSISNLKSYAVPTLIGNFLKSFNF